MTYKEQFAKDHPRMTPGDLELFYSHFCPESVYNVDDPEGCTGTNEDGRCDLCWNREIPEPEKSIKIDFLKSGSGIAFGTIKDSGDRTEFATGAVRDMREGKGRCDLMPLEVVAEYFGRFYCRVDNAMNTAEQIFHNIQTFMDTSDTEFLYLALRNFENTTVIIPTLFLEVAKHFEEGAKKYGENNWQKGIPAKCYIDSAVRHYLKWLRGDKDEPHDRAFVWNLMCCIWEVDYHKEETHEEN
jgi:hypothetical protein